MGVAISSNQFDLNNTVGLQKPIIFCDTPKSIDVMTVSISRQLSKMLIQCVNKQRTRRLEAYFNEIIDTLPDDVAITDFDVMFNPEYKVDVLKILINAHRRKPFYIIWPGKYVDGILIYAETGYPDYKVFNVNDYDITCVI